MPAPTGPTSPELKTLIADIRARGYKEKIKFLIRLAKLLEKPERRRAEVKLSRIDRYSKENEVIVVPGKVLSDGMLTKKVSIAAFKFSEEAEKKIEKSGGKVLSIKELIDKNPKGTDVRIMV